MFRITVLVALLFATPAGALGIMQIYIAPPTGATWTIDAESSDDIASVKQKITDRLGIDPAQQHLFLAGKELLDDRTLSDYNIQPRTTLVLVITQPNVAGDILNGHAMAQVQAVTDAIGQRFQSDRTQGHRFWISSTARGGDDRGGNITAGVDTDIGADVLLGLYTAFDWTNIGGQSARSPVLGVYLGAMLDGVTLDANIGAARPDYRLPDGDFSGKRTLGSLGVTGSWRFADLTLAPSLRLSGYDETTDSSQRHYRAARGNLRASFGGDTFHPYADIALGRANFVGAGDQSWATRRVAIGATGPWGPGQFSIDLSSGDDQGAERRAELTYLISF